MRQILFVILAAHWLFLTAAMDSGCKGKKGSGSGVPAEKPRPASFLLKKLNEDDSDKLRRYVASFKVAYEDPGQSFTASGNLIWVRDSVIWLNFKKFGLEAARVLVTRDSVWMLNRLEKTWSADGLESLQRKYKLPAGFEVLQCAILARPWFFQDIELKSDVRDSLHRLSGANGRFAADYRIQEGSYYLQSQTFLQIRESNSLSIGFDDFKKTAKLGDFPYLRRVEAFSPAAGQIRATIQFTDFEPNISRPIRFEIPDHYERVD